MSDTSSILVVLVILIVLCYFTGMGNISGSSLDNDIHVDKMKKKKKKKIQQQPSSSSSSSTIPQWDDKPDFPVEYGNPNEPTGKTSLSLGEMLAKSKHFKEDVDNVCKNRDFMPDWNADRWNDSDYVKHNNCMAYAFLDRTESINRTGKPQPGKRSGLPPLEGNNYTCPAFISRLQSDYPGTLVKDGEDKSPCPCGYYKVALVMDNVGEDKDYHFYRQDSNGFWSHKPGSTQVTNLDASGNYIIDPLVADRNYDKNDTHKYNYDKSCGYLCVPANKRWEEIVGGDNKVFENTLDMKYKRSI